MTTDANGEAEVLWQMPGTGPGTIHMEVQAMGVAPTRPRHVRV